ncbi:MAG: lipoprotein [Clostridia bacterium]|jgi:D-methionine transport system substrate-binding protein|nr:lipoprotein [Clostridia bacterium]
MKKKLSLVLSAVVLGASILTGCGAQKTETTEKEPAVTESAKEEAPAADTEASAGSSDKKTIIFGAAPGPYGDMAKYAIKPSLEAKGYTVEIKEFSDYVQPNLALANGEIDVNIFQHRVYLENFAKEHNLEITHVINIPTAALAFYSKNIKSLEELKEGSTLTIPNDVTNLTRALKQAQKAGLLKIDENADKATFSEKNVTENPLNLKITPVEAAQLPRTLESSDLAAIPGNYAIAAGIDLRTALYTEQLTEEYKNLIAVKNSDLDAQFVKDIKEVVESEAFKNVIESEEYLFSGFQKPDWYKTKWGK